MHKTVYFLIDCSGSMRGKRGDVVNALMEEVMRTVVPEILAEKLPDLKIQFVVLGFAGADTIKVLIPETDLESLPQWTPLPEESFAGGTPTGAAIQAVIEDIEGGLHGDIDPYALPPVIILISDGAPTGSNPTYDEVMECAVKGSSKEVSAFRRATRVAIGMNVCEEGRTSIKKFGRIPKAMENFGLSAYYDLPAQLEALRYSMREIIDPPSFPPSFTDW